MVPFSAYEAVFAHSPIGECLFSAAAEPVILAVNDAFLATSSRRRDELVGLPLFEVFPKNPGDPLDTGAAALRASLAEVLATGRAHALPLQRYPIMVVAEDGSERYEERFWSAVNVPVFDDRGELVCINHRTEDVTSRVRVEAAMEGLASRQAFQLELSDRLRQLASPENIVATGADLLGRRLDASRVLFAEVDESQQLFYVRQSWTRSSLPEMVGEHRRLEDFGPEIVGMLRRGEPMVVDDVRSDPRTATHADAYALIGVRSNLAIPVIRGDTMVCILSLHDGAPRHWSAEDVALATDVAERTWAAAETARAQCELREASHRKDEFLAMLAHELRNPLAPISAAAELMSTMPLDVDRIRQTSRIIGRQVRHLTALVDDLLDVSRVTRGLVALDRQPQDLKQVLSNAVEQVRPAIESNRHRLTIELSPAPTWVDGDAKRLVQVFTNLLSNAAKYTPSGGVIQLDVRIDGANVVASVRDNGVGIAPALQARVFELFTQGERTIDRAQGGLGLGLALVRSLVELHGGTVRCQSGGVGEGATFSVTLPLRTAVVEPVVAATAVPIATATRPLRVLVVDDNVDAARMLCMLLEAAGHHVMVETDPHQALERASAEPPDVGLLDIGLPGMDGYALVRKLRSAPATRNAVWIALTGYGQARDREMAREAGFEHHLVKPVDATALVGLLEQLSV